MFIREDWTLFRTLSTLPQKAGVSAGELRRLMLKELVDNALDATGSVEFGKVGRDTYWVEDRGPGLPGSAEDIARLFSVARPLTSSKVVRLPTRGALGNGLRVVVGLVLSSGGHLEVETRGSRYTLRPRHDGSTAVEGVSPSRVAGTRVTVHLGEGIPEDDADLSWAQLAQQFSFSARYAGKTSAYWYNTDAFHELLLAAGGRRVLEVVGLFDGFGYDKGEVDPEAVLDSDARCRASECDRQTADRILRRLRTHSKPVPPTKLGGVGKDVAEAYKRVEGTLVVKPGTAGQNAEIPYVVESWAVGRSAGERDSIIGYVNGTPITGRLWFERHKGGKVAVFGCGLHNYVEGTARDPFLVMVNVTTPHMPITTDGKEPDFSRFLRPLQQAIAASTKKLKRVIQKAKGVSSQTQVVTSYLDRAVREVSDGGRYRYSLRQLYYVMRPYVLRLCDTGELDYGHFSRIVGQYEAEWGELEGMYRDPRGTLYHPHLRRTIPIGTLAVEEYERPRWTFNKILYCEKEGFNHLLISEGWPERMDCALLSSKGFASRAVRDLLDLLGDTAEELTFFCIHDADSAGTLIYQTLQEGTPARSRRRVEIINLGLDPWEALEMGLQVETFKPGRSRRPVARYVQRAWEQDIDPPPGGDDWEDWLQTNRVELNAMTSRQFLAWLSERIARHDRGKVIPPARVLHETLQEEAEAAVRLRLTTRILQENGLDRLVQAEMERLRPRLSTIPVREEVEDRLSERPSERWTTPLREIAEALTTNA